MASVLSYVPLIIRLPWHQGRSVSCLITALLLFFAMTGVAFAATSIPFTINMSEAVNVAGTPRIAVNVGGVSRYATYSAGTGTAALTFTYDMVAGDVDLDGVTLTSPIDLNGGTIQDLNGNDAILSFTVPNTSNVRVSYPSLSMDFVYDADGRYTVGSTVYNNPLSFLSAVGGSFTRGSVGTYFDSTGTLQTASSGTPRFDYDPVTHAARGILIEEGRTNLFVRSSEIDNASWSKAGGGANIAVTPNAAIAPDGTMAADYVASTGVSNSFISIRAPFNASDTVTCSIFARAGTSSRVIFEYYDNGVYLVTNFNLSTLTYTAGTGMTARIANVGNGWYRLSVTKTFTQSSASAFVGTFYIDQYGTGAAGQGVYLWGAQAEIGAFPTSYIPTTTTTVPRAADLMTIPTGSWYNAGNSTFVATAYGETNSTQANRGRWIGANSGLVLGNEGALTNVGTWSGTSPTLVVTYSPATSQSQYAKAAVSWDTSSVTRSMVANGGTVSTGSIPGTYGFSQIYIGSTGGGNFLNAPLRDVKYYPLRASDTQLRLLTQ